MFISLQNFFITPDPGSLYFHNTILLCCVNRKTAKIWTFLSNQNFHWYTRNVRSNWQIVFKMYRIHLTPVRTFLCYHPQGRRCTQNNLQTISILPWNILKSFMLLMTCLLSMVLWLSHHQHPQGQLDIIGSNIYKTLTNQGFAAGPPHLKWRPPRLTM